MIDRFCEGIDRLFLFIDRFGDYLIVAQLSSLYAQRLLSFPQRFIYTQHFFAYSQLPKRFAQHLPQYFIYKLILIEKKHGGSHSHCDSPCFLSATWFR